MTWRTLLETDSDEITIDSDAEGSSDEPTPLLPDPIFRPDD
jgi:hypothetical protein